MITLPYETTLLEVLIVQTRRLAKKDCKQQYKGKADRI
jgi:hypothetical protein